MNRILELTRRHTLALLCWMVAFFFWKDYFTHPHHPVTRAELLSIRGEVATSGTLISLPSGTRSGYSVVLEGPKRSFTVPGMQAREFEDEVPEHATVTIAYSPEEDLSVPGEAVTAFSLKYKEKEYVYQAGDVDWYNRAITGKLKAAAGTTLAGFAALGLVWFIRKRFLRA